MRRKKRWTDAEVEKLRSMVGKHSQDQIAQGLGRPRGSVSTKASELNLSGLSPPSTKTRQHRPWPSRDGPHRLDTAAETPFFPISSLLDGSLQTRVLKWTAGAGAPATEPQYRSGHRLSP